MTINLMRPLPSNETFIPSVILPTRPRHANAVLTPAWFAMPELTAAMNFTQARTAALASLSAQELALRTKEAQKHEIGFISNARFTAKNAAKEIFSASIALTSPKPHSDTANELRTNQNPNDGLGRLCEASLLNQAQEKLLFQRMNFLRYQAAKQRTLLSDEAPSASRLCLIDRLRGLADWHRDRIVEANTRLVFSVVKTFVNDNNRFDDLLSDGVMALIHAVDKFDFDRGFRFSTYATTVLRRNAYREVLENQQRRMKTVTGLDDMKIDVMDERTDNVIAESRWQRLRGRLREMLSELDRRERFIIRARFSLGSHRKVSTLQSLANRLGVSKERVRQLEYRGLEKLRLMADRIEA